MHTKARFRDALVTTLVSAAIAEAAGALVQLFATPGPAQQLQKQRRKAQLNVLSLPGGNLLAEMVVSLCQGAVQILAGCVPIWTSSRTVFQLFTSCDLHCALQRHWGSPRTALECEERYAPCLSDYFSLELLQLFATPLAQQLQQRLFGTPTCLCSRKETGCCQLAEKPSCQESDLFGALCVDAWSKYVRTVFKNRSGRQISPLGSQRN